MSLFLFKRNEIFLSKVDANHLIHNPASTETAFSSTVEADSEIYLNSASLKQPSQMQPLHSPICWLNEYCRCWLNKSCGRLSRRQRPF